MDLKKYFLAKVYELHENDKLLMISDNDEALLQSYESLGIKGFTMKKINTDKLRTFVTTI